MAPVPGNAREWKFDTLLVAELSANLYGTWGTAWQDCLQLEQHLSCLRLFLWVLSRAIECSVASLFETVLCDDGSVHSYRLWLPLADDAVDQFVTACAAAMPAWAESRPVKARKVATHPGAAANLPLKQDVVRAMGTYLGGVAIADIGVAPVIDGECTEGHVLHTLGAAAHFSRRQARYSAAHVCKSQSRLSSYIPSGRGGKRLLFPNLGLVKTGKGLLHGDGLLKHALPDQEPSEAQQNAARLAVAHATDGECQTTDVSGFASLASEDACVRDGALAGLLTAIYPVIERVRLANRARISQQGLSCFPRIAEQLHTLFSVRVRGVPTVYAAGQAELADRLNEMREPSSDQATTLAQRMFFCKPGGNYTPCGHVIASIVSGVCGAARLLPAQQRLFLLLFLRSHKIAANHLGSQGFVVCCGPPETGKSMACQAWLGALPRFLVQVKDVVSAKSYTAMDEDADLRACFRDEMHELACKGARDDPNTRAQQTLSSNGLIQIERLIRDEETGEFCLTKTPKAGRTLTVTCTNNLNDVPQAIISRATVVAVPATRSKHARGDAGTLASIGMSATNALAEGFTKFCQTLAAMQVEYWSADAAGMMELDDRMVLVYRLVATAHKAQALSARRMNEVRHTATSIMVLDLTSQWVRGGVGAEHGFDRGKQLEFFALNSYLKMEHVLAAVGVAAMTTNVDHEVEAVKLSLREMIKTDTMGGVSPFPGDSDYFELNTTRRRIADDVADRNEALGAGLAKAIVRTVHKASTGKKQHIRYVVDELNHEHCLIYAPFVASAVAPTEGYLFEHMRHAPKEVSWDGEFYVFRPRLTEKYTCAGEEGVRKDMPQVSQAEMQIALAMLRSRMVTVDGKQRAAFWQGNRVEVRRPALDSPHAIEIDGKMYVKKTELQALCVHRSLLEQRAAVNSSRQRELFQACLAIAGGYEGKEVAVGIGPSHRGAATVSVGSTHSSVTVDNPMHTDASLGDLLGDLAPPTDTIFPAHTPTLTWTSDSKLEDVCRHDTRARLSTCA